MLMLKIAVRNIFRNTRRSIAILATIAIGAAAILVFGAYVRYAEYGVQTAAVQSTGHLQIFRTGYFDYGAGAPAEWGLDHYQGLLDQLRNDPVLKPLVVVATPVQALTGIASYAPRNTSKTFLGSGFVPSDRDRMKQWNEYGTGSTGLKHSGMRDDDRSTGIAGAGFIRILDACSGLGLADCPARPVSRTVEIDAPRDDKLLDLARQDSPSPDSAAGGSAPAIDLLSATTGGAPNVVSLRIARVEVQPFKEYDDTYVGMPIGLAQDLIYGRGERKVTGIVLQLTRTEDLAAARNRVNSLKKEGNLDIELRDFTELNPQYDQIIGLFESIFSFIATIMVVIVLFTVSSAMGMSVLERTDEIGTSRAMGVRRRGIGAQFLIEGGLLGGIGASLGVASADCIAYAINHAGLTWRPPGSGGPVPLKLYLETPSAFVALTWAGLIAVATVAALLPAIRAARLPVVDALRHV